MKDYTRDILKDLAIAHFGFEHPTTIEIFSIDERETDTPTAVGKMIEAFGEGLEREKNEEDI